MNIEVVEKVYARVGLLGNPSDTYNGQVISFALKNFSATVKLTPQEQGVTIVPHPVLDSTTYSSMEHLWKHTSTCGYYGGVRLLQASCKCFFAWCAKNSLDLELRGTCGFSLSYETDIPRQSGLSGSSAIVLAALKCMMHFFGVVIPQVELPCVVLSAEEDLGINAGLQDRVVQVYGGLVHMDFSDQKQMAEKGFGKYTSMDVSKLPDLYIMYAAEDIGSESGRVHADVRQRWLAGDTDVREGMEQIASCAREGRAAIECSDTVALGLLMSKNFTMRRAMFGDPALGANNIGMVELAVEHGCCAKFCGSGGSVVLLCPPSARLEELAARAQGKGLVLVKAEVGIVSSYVM
eukprot:gene20857-27692_t